MGQPQDTWPVSDLKPTVVSSSPGPSSPSARPTFLQLPAHLFTVCLPSLLYLLPIPLYELVYCRRGHAPRTRVHP